MEFRDIALYDVQNVSFLTIMENVELHGLTVMVSIMNTRFRRTWGQRRNTQRERKAQLWRSSVEPQSHSVEQGNIEKAFDIVLRYKSVTSMEKKGIPRKLMEEVQLPCNRKALELQTSKINFVFGDFNSKIGRIKHGIEAWICPYGSGERNKRGLKLLIKHYSVHIKQIKPSPSNTKEKQQQKLSLKC
ncbi:Protein of unknown function [Gryllus bimaculatus]|nr:Protein of unknown function [Gryllus bimaculatus]